MGGQTDQIKGAAGELTGNERLKRKGKLDQVVGKVKQTAGKAVDKILVNNYRSQFDRVIARSSFEDLVRLIKEKQS